MGGWSFTVKDVRELHEIECFNGPCGCVWADAVISAGEADILDNARCPFDVDGVCQERGCLNSENRTRGYQLDIRDFLAMNRRVLVLLESNPDCLPNVQTWASVDFELLSKGVQPAEAIQEKEMTDGEQAIHVTKALIESLEYAISKGARQVLIWDRWQDIDFYPCPRSWYTREVAEDGKVIMHEDILPYDEAIEKRKSGEWEDNIRLAWESE